jgi:hypothetical protein
LQLHYSAVISYNAGLASVKISILFLYLRLFGPAFIVLRRVSYAFLGIVVIAGLWGIFSAAIFCWPVASFWDTSIKGSCLPQKPRWLSVASLNLATDFMIFFLPLPVIAKMQMPKGEKICLIFVLTVGFLSVILSLPFSGLSAEPA